MIPNHGNQTQKIPPKTSVSERRVKSVAGKSFDFIENKISPEQTKNPCNAESEEFFKEINILLSLNNKTKIATAEWSWNARFADLDNDQWQDLYVTNGVPITQEFAANNFFHNQKGKAFNSSAKEFGLDDYDHSSSYTYLDIDRDGDLDIIANTLYGSFKVYTNNESKNNSITFKLRDKKGNRFCLGCRIIILYGKNGEKHQKWSYSC